MDDFFKLEIVNPEKSFLLQEDLVEVVVPAYEGEMGILKDHIAIISFLKPGILKTKSKSKEESYYIEDGIFEFKDNSLSILTSSVINLKDIKKEYIEKEIETARNVSNKTNVNDQLKFLMSQKIEALENLKIN
tara:strand:+ start:236 stop:634 length:399 start_codon:yes stop_codon:yes gene_type:complete